MPSQADLATEALLLAAPYDTAADFVLSRQIIVAWAGEAGDEEGDRRLGWWKTNLIAEFGGIDLMKRLVPRTFEWAVIQGCLEAARHRDAELRNKANDPDQLLTLFGLGFEVDEQLDERLHDHKASGQPRLFPISADLSSDLGTRPIFSNGWQATVRLTFTSAQRAGSSKALCPNP